MQRSMTGSISILPNPTTAMAGSERRYRENRFQTSRQRSLIATRARGQDSCQE